MAQPCKNCEDKGKQGWGNGPRSVPREADGKQGCKTKGLAVSQGLGWHGSLGPGNTARFDQPPKEIPVV